MVISVKIPVYMIEAPQQSFFLHAFFFFFHYDATPSLLTTTPFFRKNDPSWPHRNTKLKSISR